MNSMSDGTFYCNDEINNMMQLAISLLDSIDYSKRGEGIRIGGIIFFKEEESRSYSSNLPPRIRYRFKDDEDNFFNYDSLASNEGFMKALEDKKKAVEKLREARFSEIDREALRVHREQTRLINKALRVRG